MEMKVAGGESNECDCGEMSWNCGDKYGEESRHFAPAVEVGCG
jgi:hypothetical protein